ncbi:MAG: thiamine pyrophosphate-binding protein [Deltaproteobacteria bacterium]|nr:thiamine pyrophosphate-binding protein [Deltaproteobacteria bacterium]
MSQHNGGSQENGGAIIGEVLARHGVKLLFTLCGGHISPILVEAKARGVRVVDVRDEASAVFAADAVARMTGVPGVAAVTAGPGVTNSVTALKNAQMAQSPVVLLGGATATVLKGRGSLQDIDQLSLVRPLTKWATTVKTVADLGPTMERAMEVSRSGVPGPVFVEVPVDLLYREELVRDWYLKESGAKSAKGILGNALRLYLEGHLYRQFHAPRIPELFPIPRPSLRVPSLTEVVAELPPPSRDTAAQVREVASLLEAAERPVLVMGSQALVNCVDPERIASAVRRLGIPTFLGGMSRGLLGKTSRQQFRHQRQKALKEADLVIVAGFPFDFRLGYGRSISSKAKVVAANLSVRELRKNRRPDVAVRIHPGEFLVALASCARDGAGHRDAWRTTLSAREDARDAEISAQAEVPSDLVNPLRFFLRLEEKMADDAVLVVDGGDFVATASYILRPRAPLSWLDPGVFGTLGVGGGFAVGAAAARPGREVWLLFGDGSSAYSLAEFDTFARHGLSPIAVIGNDASWAQIAREQVEVLGDDVGTVLCRRDYHLVAEGYGGKGLLLDDSNRIDEVIDKAKEIASQGKPVCVNVHLSRSEFRKGSISM